MKSKFNVPNVLRIEKALREALEDESRKHYTPYSPKNSRGYACSALNCPNFAFAKGLCNAHYTRRRLGTRFDKPLRCWNRKLICESCGGDTNSKGGWNLCPRCCSRRRTEVLKRTLVHLFGNRCGACRRIYPLPCFDFHHVRGKKRCGVSTAMGFGSIKFIAEEAAKCVLRCANCHRLEDNHGKF